VAAIHISMTGLFPSLHRVNLLSRVSYFTTFAYFCQGVFLFVFSFRFFLKRFLIYHIHLFLSTDFFIFLFFFLLRFAFSQREFHSTPSFVNCKAFSRNNYLPLSVTNYIILPITQAF